MFKKRILFTKFFLSSPFYKTALLFLLLFTIFFLGSLILAPSYITAQQSTDNFLSYSNPTYNIKIDYPADWEKIEGSSGFLGQAHSKNVSLVVGFSPPDKSANVFVTIEKLTPNMTLTQDLNETITITKKDIPDYKILESEQTTLAGLPAYKLVSEQTIPLRKLGEKFGIPNEKIEEMESMLQAFGGKLTIKTMYVFAVKDNKEYAVTFGSAPGIILGDQYSVYLPIAQRMIDSFQLTGSSPGPNGLPIKPKIDGQSQMCGQLLDTLKARLVEGNITIQQYGDLRKAIGC